MTTGMPIALRAVRNGDVDWDSFDVHEYLEDNYVRLHRADRQIITHLSDFYRRIPPASVTRSLEVGAGPNLYPLMLAGAASRSIEVVELSAANVAHLERVLAGDPSSSWTPFWRLCRDLNPALPTGLGSVLGRVRVRQGNAFELPRGRYGLASMFFVAESVTADDDEFTTLCERFARSVAPGGYLVAAFMAGMEGYRLGTAVLPSFALHRETQVEEVLRPFATDLRVVRIGPDDALPYHYDGMFLMTGRSTGR